jgi:arabinofuranan 3-O-arabinosyltransferase
MATVRGAAARALAGRPGPVLSPGLLKRIATCYVAFTALVYGIDLLRQTRDRLTDGAGRPFGDDFVNYWSAAFLAWHHRADEIYNALAFHAFQQSIVGEQLGGFHYSYPPVMLLLTAPLGFIPYVPALALWLAAGWFVFFLALRAAMPNGRALLFALATPAVFINAVAGQNGTWTAALFGGALALLDRRPMLAGSLFGLLIYKPHLGLLIPVALLAGRRWSAFAAAAATAGGLILVSVICFGPDIYSECLRQLEILRHAVLEDGTGVWHRMLSVFVAARRLGADVTAAYIIQAVAAAIAALVVAVLWFRDASFGIRNAALVLGTCLATPYLQDYDLVISALVVAWLMRDASIPATLERPVFYASALLLLIPLIAASMGMLTGLGFGPLFIIPAFAIVARAGFSPAAVPARTVAPAMP